MLLLVVLGWLLPEKPAIEAKPSSSPPRKKGLLIDDVADDSILMEFFWRQSKTLRREKERVNGLREKRVGRNEGRL